MPQGPLATLDFALSGTHSALNVTAAGVIKAYPGRLMWLHVVAPGSAGVWTFNDCLTSGTVAAANEIISIPYNFTGIVAGSFVNLNNFPFSVGIYLSVVPSAGSPIASIIYA
jgi:hypothetical protein